MLFTYLENPICSFLDDYASALNKLQKSIRIFNILMFYEEGRGIGSAKVETVKPWLETLKDMEKRISSKDKYRHNDTNDNCRDGKSFDSESDVLFFQMRVKECS